MKRLELSAFTQENSDWFGQRQSPNRNLTSSPTEPNESIRCRCRGGVGRLLAANRPIFAPMSRPCRATQRPKTTAKITKGGASAPVAEAGDSLRFRPPSRLCDPISRWRCRGEPRHSRWQCAREGPLAHYIRALGGRQAALRPGLQARKWTLSPDRPCVALRGTPFPQGPIRRPRPR